MANVHNLQFGVRLQGINHLALGPGVPTEVDLPQRRATLVHRMKIALQNAILQIELLQFGEGSCDDVQRVLPEPPAVMNSQFF